MDGTGDMNFIAIGEQIVENMVLEQNRVPLGHKINHTNTYCDERQEMKVPTTRKMKKKSFKERKCT